jgi:Uncharacterised nucleotidyltransferase
LPLLSNPVPSRKAEIRDLSVPSVVRRKPEQSREVRPQVRMFTISTNITPNPLSREQLIREAVLLAFCEPLPEQCSRLQSISKNEWQRLLHWLDISGLALYFLDRMTELRMCNLLPPSVLARLQQNLHDNIERTRGMIAESVAIQQELQDSCLCYATLKGFSLYPSSVPKPELRHQFDIDFLVAEKSAPEARHILERRGYRLYAITGRSWEFKINETPGSSMKNFYKDSPGQSVELHVEANISGRTSLLGRTEKREFYGISMPVLSPVDLFLGQGLHVYKHICSEFSRTAHLLEFRRHVLLRRDEDAFWDELRSIAEENPRASLGLGVVVLLTTHVMGDFAPEAFTNWTVDRLPESARLWVKIYGRRVVFGSFPGSKLYLLLQRELESSGVPAKRSLRQVLLPRRLPPAVIRASASDTLSVRVRRRRMQLHFVFSRLRFHILEGLRYIWESYRWRQHMNRVTR